MCVLQCSQNTTEEKPKRTFLGMRGGGIICEMNTVMRRWVADADGLRQWISALVLFAASACKQFDEGCDEDEPVTD